MHHTVNGSIVGAILGAVVGLGSSLWLSPDTLLLPAVTMVAGALLGGVCGYAHGDEFFEWLKDNWDAFL